MTEEIRIILGGLGGDVYITGLLEELKSGIFTEQTKRKLQTVIEKIKEEASDDPLTKELVGELAILASTAMYSCNENDLLKVAAEFDQLADPNIIGEYDAVKRKKDGE